MEINERRLHKKWAPFLLAFLTIFLSLLAIKKENTQAATVWVNNGAADVGAVTHWKRKSDGKAIVDDGFWRKRNGNSSGDALFCVELGVPLDNGSNTNFKTTPVSDAMHKHLSVIAYYGYYSRKSDTKNALWNEMYTQWRIWEALGDQLTWIPDTATRNGYANWKKQLEPSIKAFESQPSFAGQIIKIDAGTSKTITDTNGTLATYKRTPYANLSGVTLSTSGNNLIINAQKNAVHTGSTSLFQHNLPVSYQGVTLLFQRPGYQSVIYPKIDPAMKKFSVNITVNHYGKLQVTKNDALTGGTPQNGRSFAGAQFKLTDNTTGAIETLTADANGVAISGNHLIGNKYTVVETKAPEGYELNTTPITGTFSHQAGDTTWSDASLLNKVVIKDNINPDQVLIHKIDEAGKPLAGVKFVLADSLENLKAGKYLRLSGDNKVLFPTSAGYAAGKDYTITSGADGVVKWTNIIKPATKKDWTYWYRELATDSKHQLDTQVHSIGATDRGDTASTNVVNKNKIVLSATGSAETAMTIAIVLASILGLGLMSFFVYKLTEKE